MPPHPRHIAFRVPSHPPATRPQPVIEIRAPDGKLVDARQDRFAVPGPRGWSEVVRLMGYRPITRWTAVPLDYGPVAPRGAAHMCKVEPAPVAGHAAAHLAAGLLPICPASTALTKAHVVELGGDGTGLHAGDVIECEYVAGHRPPHLGLGLPGRYGGIDERLQPRMWLLWSGGEAILSEAMLCGVEGRAPGNVGAIDPCALPYGHEEVCPSHSWELTVFTSLRPGGGALGPVGRDRPPRRTGGS